MKRNLLVLMVCLTCGLVKATNYPVIEGVFSNMVEVSVSQCPNWFLISSVLVKFPLEQTNSLTLKIKKSGITNTLATAEANSTTIVLAPVYGVLLNSSDVLILESEDASNSYYRISLK